MDKSGKIIDYFGGLDDLENKILRCVRDTKDRLSEEGLRSIRAIRFRITK